MNLRFNDLARSRPATVASDSRLNIDLLHAPLIIFPSQYLQLLSVSVNYSFNISATHVPVAHAFHHPFEFIAGLLGAL